MTGGTFTHVPPLWLRPWKVNQWMYDTSKPTILALESIKIHYKAAGAKWKQGAEPF